MFCRKCGTHNNDSANFCRNCGINLQVSAITKNVGPIPAPALAVAATGTVPAPEPARGLSHASATQLTETMPPPDILPDKDEGWIKIALVFMSVFAILVLIAGAYYSYRQHHATAVSSAGPDFQPAVSTPQQLSENTSADTIFPCPGNAPFCIGKVDSKLQDPTCPADKPIWAHYAETGSWKRAGCYATEVEAKKALNNVLGIAAPELSAAPAIQTKPEIAPAQPETKPALESKKTKKVTLKPQFASEPSIKSSTSENLAVNTTYADGTPGPVIHTKSAQEAAEWRGKWEHPAVQCSAEQKLCWGADPGCDSQHPIAVVIQIDSGVKRIPPACVASAAEAKQAAASYAQKHGINMNAAESNENGDGKGYTAKFKLAFIVVEKRTYPTQEMKQKAQELWDRERKILEPNGSINDKYVTQQTSTTGPIPGH